MSVHKAEPDVVGTTRGDPRCSYCDGQIHQVPGGHGPTWVHSDGYVAGVLPEPVAPNDQPDEYFRDNTGAAYSWITQHMSVECDEALARFVLTNPNLRGIDLWTALDMLLDADAHLDIMEPLAETMPGWGALHRYVTLILLYNSKDFSQTWTDEMRAIAVRATIDNNSRMIGR